MPTTTAACQSPASDGVVEAAGCAAADCAMVIDSATQAGPLRRSTPASSVITVRLPRYWMEPCKRTTSNSCVNVERTQSLSTVSVT